ncbi:hypothetical protein GCM10010174_30140 [Kutzneria viridogrisea]|uniref:Uncharacterized protein n=2 Tax=Kutzneria TaxID=43356 RepID=W5VZF4_9PSEU|nr:hypothetical protein [Kutzneria albida]AHH93641.1 hypothetical protein KALB_264 [Kutzneria albida DSM 43870]MBA8928975.1 putative Tic20 family protein [Kutzneria viridogrisea]
MGSGGKKSGGVLSTVINLFGVLTALVMVVHVLLVLTKANTGNVFFTIVEKWANLLVLWWGNVFKPVDAPGNVALNYLLAAAFWLLVTRIVARILR